jgi:hypothetical protein
MVWVVAPIWLNSSPPRVPITWEAYARAAGPTLGCPRFPTWSHLAFRPESSPRHPVYLREVRRRTALAAGAAFFRSAAFFRVRILTVGSGSS